ncbi:DUF4209 domain-containing protein [Pseudarthrobacter sp. NPDC092439]|uniref:DUF4209 domain-containing protein n=1 Tax=unclassified Pseudarthrobacter TaxID=2647000 RepID=UPI00382C4F31
MTNRAENTPSEDSDRSELRFEWPQEVIGLIEKAIQETSEIYEMSARVRGALPDELEDHVRAFVQALDYHRIRTDTVRETADDHYGPMVTTKEGYAYPQPLSAVPAQSVAAWQDSAQLFGSNDVITARLNDLLWVVKAKPRPDRHARSAQAAYRRMWGHNSLSPVHRSDGLTRALELAVELGDSNLVEETVPELVSAVRETLGGEEWAPGVALPMIEALAALRPPARPAELDQLIAEALDRYREDPFIVEAVQLLRMQRAPHAAERKRIALETVHMWRQQAEVRGGLVGIAHIERALELARNEGLSEIANELRVQLQQPKTTEELGMELVSSDISLPKEVIEGFINEFTVTSGSEESYAKLAAYIPIRDLEADAEHVRVQMREFPVQHLFSTVVTNSEGLPLAHISTEEQKFAHALVQHHSFAITFWGGFMGEILERLGSQGRLAEADVRTLSTGEFVDTETSDGIAQAYRHFLVGDFEAALHYLLVRIERVLRNMAQALGLPTYREPSLDGKSLGGYKGLGELLALLEGRVPENARRYLSVLLSERTGLNLRNRSAHGLMQVVSRDEAALAFHVMTVLSRWSTVDDDRTEDSSGASAAQGA